MTQYIIHVRTSRNGKWPADPDGIRALRRYLKSLARRAGLNVVGVFPTEEPLPSWQEFRGQPGERAEGER